MYKIFLYLTFAVLFLSSCKTRIERQKIYQADYYRYSCPQLYQKYIWIKQKYDHASNSRIFLNTANNMVEVLDPQNPSTRYHTPSYEEGDYEIQMKAIENVAIDKHCEGVSF